MAILNNPGNFNDPNGLCPDCPDTRLMKEGDKANPHCEREYTFSEGKWTAGGMLDKVTVTDSEGRDNGSPGGCRVLKDFDL